MPKAGLAALVGARLGAVGRLGETASSQWVCHANKDDGANSKKSVVCVPSGILEGTPLG